MDPRGRPTITSPANPRIREALQLRDRRGRERSGLTLVDGIREVGRAADAGVEIVELFATPSAGESGAAAALFRRLANSVPVQPVSEPAFARLAFGDRGDGIVAVVRTPPVALEHLRLPPDPLIVVVERVEKPGNLGAIVRTADGAGAEAVVVAGAATDVFNPNTIRASLGAVFALPIASAPTHGIIEWLARTGVRPVIARVDAPAVYTDADLTGALAIVVGSESEGLSDAWSDIAADAVRLPMLGISDSLNVSVAAGVLLYEARRQRDLKRKA